MPVTTGNHFWDKVTVGVSVLPNGQLDAPPTWTEDSGGFLTLTPAADGLSCEIQADSDVRAWAVTVTAPADNPSTPALESVSNSFEGSFSHSKATELPGSFVEHPRP